MCASQGRAGPGISESQLTATDPRAAATAGDSDGHGSRARKPLRWLPAGTSTVRRPGPSKGFSQSQWKRILGQGQVFGRPRPPAPPRARPGDGAGGMAQRKRAGGDSGSDQVAQPSSPGPQNEPCRAQCPRGPTRSGKVLWIGVGVHAANGRSSLRRRRRALRS